MKYTTKQDVANKRIIKKDGKILKLSVLEFWYSKGYLEFNKSQYTADERLKYGLRLSLDFQIINRANIHSGYIQNSKIDKINNSIWEMISQGKNACLTFFSLGLGKC